jgi:hypothetical protein
LPRDPTSQNNNENQQDSAQSHEQSPRSNTVHSQLVPTSDHPCGLHFNNDLADHQRKQFECDMTRKSSSKYDIIFIL